MINLIRMLRTSANHLLHLVNDVLDYSKIEADKLELEKAAFNIHKVCTSSLLHSSLFFSPEDFDVH